MSVRRVFAVLIALAMLFAPAAMQGAGAAAPSGHQVQLSEAGHCPDAGGEADLDEGPDCCAAMCAGAALAPAVAAVLPPARLANGPPSAQSPGRGYLARLATPPPRRA